MNPALDPKVQTAVRPDSTWLSLLKVSAREVFQIMLQLELDKLSNAEELAVSGDVTSMVGLAGALCGVLSIRCDSHTAEEIAGRMLGSVGTVSPEEVPDAMA